jgi:lysophospholipase L1-like esterase
LGMGPVVRAVAMPIWQAQGLKVALTTARLPEAAGPRAGRVGAGNLRLLILGDSSAAGVGVPTQDQALAGQLVEALGRVTDGIGLDWRLLARTGVTTAGMVDWLRVAPADPADLAVVALGVNDVTRGLPMRRWLSHQAALASVLKGRFGVRRIYISGVPPMGAFPVLPSPLRDVLGARAARFDAALAALTLTVPGARHLPFDLGRLQPEMMASDGFHPGAPIYADWARALADSILADLPLDQPAGT